MALRLASTTATRLDARLGAVLSLAIMVAAHGLRGAPPEASQPPPIRPLRYEEDYSYLRHPAARTGGFLRLEPLKYIPLNPAGDWNLSLGGEVRLEYESYNNLGFGSAANDDSGGYLLQRYSVHADLHAGERLRFFGQLYAAPSAFEDIEPSPADQDDLRLQQAFADALLLTGSDHAPLLILRVGRQELLYGSERLVSVREGLNVRRSFDAVRLIGEFGPWRVDGFLGRPVEVDRKAFHDWGEQEAMFWGVYATRPLAIIQGAGIDLYYLGLRRDDAAFNQGVANELRHTVGSRLLGQSGPWDYNFEAILQFGEFGRGDILAWSVASDTGYTFEGAPLRPRLGLRAAIVSGDDDPQDDDLGTINPLFPRGDYFGESSLIGPANLLNIHPNLRLELTEDVSLKAGWDFYWRYSVDDGVYGPAGNIIQSPNGGSERYVGSEASLLLDWRISRELSFRAGYSHFFAGSFLKDAGRSEDVDYFSFTLTYRF